MKVPHLCTLLSLLFVAISPAADSPTRSPENVSVEEAAKILKERKDVVVIDVRTPDEFQAGHIPGATNIDLLGTDFATRLAALDKSKTYLVHCASGGRSTRSLKTFEEQKFSSLLHLKDGFKAWEKAGQPVEK